MTFAAAQGSLSRSVSFSAILSHRFKESSLMSLQIQAAGDRTVFRKTNAKPDRNLSVTPAGRG
jgi:hypothetical protein